MDARGWGRAGRVWMIASSPLPRSRFGIRRELLYPDPGSDRSLTKVNSLKMVLNAMRN